MDKEDLESQVAKLKEEVRQGKFRLADEQDSHSHVECNEVIAKLKERLYKIIGDESCGTFASYEQLFDEVAKLKEELETWKNTVITQHKVFEEQEKQILQLKSTLDEIKKLSIKHDYVKFDLNQELKIVIAKHEND